MPRALQPWAQEARRILSDEGPQPHTLLVTRLVPLVHPGKAMRKYRKRDIRKGSRPLTDAQQVASGSRSVVTGGLHGMQDRGIVRRYIQDGVRYVEITEWGRARFEHSHRSNSKYGNKEDPAL